MVNVFKLSKHKPSMSLDTFYIYYYYVKPDFKLLNSWALRCAVYYGLDRIVHELVPDESVPITSTVIVHAVMQSRPDYLGPMLDMTVDLTSRGRRSIIVAMMGCKNVSVVRLLLASPLFTVEDFGASIIGGTILNNPEATRLVIEDGRIDIMRDGCALFDYFIKWNRNPKILRLLLEDPRAANIPARTVRDAIRFACRFGSVNNLIYMLCDERFTIHVGCHLVNLAVEENRIEVVRVLLACSSLGEHINLAQTDGPIHIAAVDDRIDIARLLLTDHRWRVSSRNIIKINSICSYEMGLLLDSCERWK